MTRARIAAVAASLLVARASCDMVKIKMAEGARVAKPKGGKAKAAKEPELPFVEIAPAIGPDPLLLLEGHCFHTTHGDYHWHVCPFNNVTQSEIASDKSSSSEPATEYVLGRWTGVWATATTMTFGDGDSCGSKRRRAECTFECGADDFALHGIGEPMICNYVMQLALPIPCSMLESARPFVALAEASDDAAALASTADAAADDATTGGAVSGSECANPDAGRFKELEAENERLREQLASLSERGAQVASDLAQAAAQLLGEGAAA